MSQAKTAAKISSWAVPTEADNEAWERMTRDEQLAACQELFNSPGCTTFTETTMAEILASSRNQRRVKAAKDGRKV